jgi:hypothetical protein
VAGRNRRPGPRTSVGEFLLAPTLTARAVVDITYPSAARSRSGG